MRRSRSSWKQDNTSRWAIVIAGVALLAMLFIFAATSEVSATEGGDQCNQYSNHSGWIPAQYDYGYGKEWNRQGQLVDEFRVPGGTHAGAPSNGGTWDKVWKCKIPVTTTTTTTTTTTLPPTTTTSSTTTTTSSTTTTTEPPTTTTTAPTTTTTEATTTTTSPTTTTSTTPTTTVPPSTSTSEAPTTTVVVTTTVTPSSTLPVTGPMGGVHWGVLVAAALGLIALGGATVVGERNRQN